jgi:hypothetical protein
MALELRPDPVGLEQECGVVAHDMAVLEMDLDPGR